MNDVDRKRPKVLIATASVGAGHNQVARAVLDGLAEHADALDVECLDVLTKSPWAFRAYYAGGFKVSMSRFPRSYGLGYFVTNRPHHPGRGLTERRRLWTERLWLRRFARYLLDLRPDLILCTHFLCAPLIARLIARGELAARLMVTVTDIEVHRFWYSEGVDRWFLPNEYPLERFRRWGVADERLTVSGIPIHAKWSQPLDRERIFAEWRLPADRPVVLLTGGTEFTCGPVVRIARGILDRCPQATLMTLAGWNKKLLGQLSRLPEAGDRLFPVAFTDRVHELVEIASLMVTKAGGITTAECLAKGTPMVILRPVPGHEAGNAAWFARQGAAVVARNAAQAIRQVGSLLGEPDRLAAMGRTAASLHRPATQTVVKAIRDALLGGDSPSG